MGDRVKIFGVVALLGFLAGVVAQLSADFILPWLWKVLPAFMNVKWIVSGVAGATITVVLISVWAYFSGSREHP